MTVVGGYGLVEQVPSFLRLGRASEHRAVERVERGIYRNRSKRSCVYRFSSDF